MTQSIEQLLPSVSRETAQELQHYSELLAKWTRKINLVAPDTVGDALRRHFVDSAQILDLVKSAPTGWADLGTGGGFLYHFHHSWALGLARPCPGGAVQIPVLAGRRIC